MSTRTEPLNSTALSHATYDDATGEMTLHFTSGQSYTYENVPAEEFEGLVRSGSPGRYFHARIKDRY